MRYASTSVVMWLLAGAFWTVCFGVALSEIVNPFMSGLQEISPENLDRAFTWYSVGWATMGVWYALVIYERTKGPHVGIFIIGWIVLYFAIAIIVKAVVEDNTIMLRWFNKPIG